MLASEKKGSAVWSIPLRRVLWFTSEIVSSSSVMSVGDDAHIQDVDTKILIVHTQSHSVPQREARHLLLRRRSLRLLRGRSAPPCAVRRPAVAVGAGLPLTLGGALISTTHRDL